MTIHRLPGDHIAITCDSPDCPLEGPTQRGATEEDLLAAAETLGWDIDRQLGLHYCDLHTIHDCEICGAPTRNALTDTATGHTAHYCEQHWPDPRDQ